jgi:hypothetical protein
MDVKLIVNRVRPDMIAKNDMMSVRDVQVRGVPVSHEKPHCGIHHARSLTRDSLGDLYSTRRWVRPPPRRLLFAQH